MTDERLETVELGRISGLHGVKGWIKIYSHTQPRDNILSYSPWLLQREGRWIPYRLERGQSHGKGVIGKLVGVDDRDAAALLVGSVIAVRRDALPPPGEEEYYWSDLVGLAVRTTNGVELGRVDHLLETGANDVLVIKGERERLIPFTREAVPEVDLETGVLTVDWDPEF